MLSWLFVNKYLTIILMKVKLLKFISLAEGKIPPDATVIFEIELYAVTKGPRSVETFKQIDTDNDRQLSKTEVIQTDFIWTVL